MIFEDGGGYCKRCSYVLPVKNKPNETEMTAKLTVDDVLKLPVKALQDRGIELETCQHYGIRTAYNEQSGKPEAYYYPMTRGNQICGYKERKLPKTFLSVGDTKNTCFIGQNAATRKGKRLLITEGQDDMLAGYQMLSKYKQDVVSLPHGANLKAFKDNEDFLNSYEEIILCADSDEAGSKLVQDVAKLYPDIKIMSITEKDANDMLLKGKSAEFVNAFFKAKQFSPVEVVEGGVGLDRLKKPLKEGIRIPSMPYLMNRLHGFREGEMTVILAPPGVGKTTVCRDIGYFLNIANEKIVNIYLEEDIEKSQQSYIALDNGVMLPNLRANPSILTDAQWQASYDKLIDNDRTMWVDHFGSINPDKLMQIVRYADSQGYKFVILDHISMVFSGLQTANERKEIDLLLTELASFTKGAKIHPIVVSHVKRTNKPLPKDNRGNIQYPYWDTVASDAARGSGAFEQLAWNIIAIEPEVLESGERGRIRLKVLKNREWGDLGMCDLLKMDKHGKLRDAQEDW